MTNSEKSHGLVAQAKRQPAKTATLGIMALMMAVVWGRNLFGGEEEKKSSSKPSPEMSASEAASSSSSSGNGTNSMASSSSTKSNKSKALFGEITDFSTAIARLDVWRQPLGIEKAVPLTAEYLARRRAEAAEQQRDRWERIQTAREAALRALADKELAVLAPPVRQSEDSDPVASIDDPTTQPVGPDLIEKVEDVELNLSGTLLLGDTRYALFGNRRVQEGERFGRYTLKAVRPREVDLEVSGMLMVVHVTPPNLGGSQ